MKRHLLNPVYWLAGIAILASIIVMTGCKDRPDRGISSAVKIITESGHGSGVHLGNGYFLTAAHVTENVKKLKVQTDDGKVRDGEILWLNHSFDVSLVFVKDHASITSASLSCSATHIGQAVSIVGNPLNTNFAKSWGRIAGTSKTGLENMDGAGLWRELVTLDVTAAPGVSGGPVYDEATGKVVGILVAGAISLRGSFAYSYMVPSTVICHMLARGA